MKETVNNLLASSFKIILFSICIFLVFYFSFREFKSWDNQKNMSFAPFIDNGFCNVVTIPISGTIGIGATFTETDPASGQMFSTIPISGDIDRIINDLEYVKNYEGIKGVILQIDSFGGVGNAAEVLLSYLKDYPLPVVSLIRDAGDSMGYWVALGGNHIIAYPGAEVGSIGVNSSFISNVDKNKKDGLEYISIVSGKYKDSGVPDKEISAEELNFLKKSNDKFFDVFVNSVMEKRNMTKEEVEKIADGRSWISSEAKELKLIDEVGDNKSALAWLEKYWMENDNLNREAFPCSQY